MKKASYSEVDIGFVPFYMDHRLIGLVDYSYPYKLKHFTFITGKPSYKPHIFGIFQTFSLTVWLTIISVLIVMPVVCYAIMKNKYTFKTITFHVFAILMKQGSMITPSSVAENFLVHAWVVGAMILGLSYNCVFLSFHSITPLTKIKHLSDLALAIESGDYHCIYPIYTGFPDEWKNSEQEHLRVIEMDIVKNI